MLGKLPQELVLALLQSGDLLKGGFMPVKKVKGGYRWGSKGKVYRGKNAKKKAEKQGRAAYANGYRGK